MNRVNRISSTVTDAALKIYEGWSLKDKKHFISQAIIDFKARRRGEIFTAEQKEYIDNAISEKINLLLSTK